MCRTRSSLFVSSLCIALVAIVLAGCGGGGSSDSSSRATIVLSSAGGLTSRTPIPTSDIESLVLTVTRIEFQRCDGNGVDDGIWNVDVKSDPASFDPTTVYIRPGGTVQWVWTADGAHTVTGGDFPVPDLVDYPFDGAGETKGDFVEFAFDVADGTDLPYFSTDPGDVEDPMTGMVVIDEFAVDVGDGGGGGHITVFTGNMQIDVVDTTTPSELSELLASVMLPSGSYCKIRLYVQDPILTLIESSPFDENAEVKLTANGRLFIGAHFELVPGGESIVEISFEKLHLVEAGGSGQLVLTPQMRADVVGTTQIEQCVLLESVNCDTNMLEVSTLGGMVPLLVMLPDGAVCDPDFLALEPGTTVLKIVGTLSTGGIVEADSIEIDPIVCLEEEEV